MTHPTRPEARLWQAVLAAGLHDAAKAEEAGWIGSRDFVQVCTFAGLDPQAVQSRFDPEIYRALIRAA